MTAIITDLFRFQNLKQVKERFDSAKDLYYVGIGRSEAWPNESIPPLPTVAPKNDLDTRNSIQSIKQLSNLAYCAPRYNWVDGNTYVAYDSDDGDLHTKQYYVFNQSNFAVYMCLKAGSSTSTVEPTGTSTAVPTAGADGYIWKYLYTITASQAAKYLTTTYVPVFRDAAVAAAAVEGAIHRIAVTTGGTGYGSAPTVTITGDGSGAAGTAVLTAGVVTSITITNVGSGYTYAKATVSGGSPTTAATLRPIIAPAAPGREIDAVTVVGGGSGYVDPQETFDGLGVDLTFTLSTGAISSVTVVDGGYNNTVASFTDTGGSGADLEFEFSAKKGGFGYDPVVELNAYYIMFNTTLVGAEGSGDFIINNDYRQVIILKNPLDTGSPQLAFSEATGMGMRYLTVAASGTWVLDDIITGGTSGAQAYLDYYDSGTERLYIHQTDTTGYAAFQDGEALTGSSTSDGDISATGGSADNAAEFDKYSGQLLYVENRVGVSRATGQTEDLKLVIQF